MQVPTSRIGRISALWLIEKREGDKARGWEAGIGNESYRFFSGDLNADRILKNGMAVLGIMDSSGSDGGALPGTLIQRKILSHLGMVFISGS